MTHSCAFPRWRWIGRKFLCRTCNTEWVCKRYIKYRVWVTPHPDGKAVRHV
jgi:hypothetical protein